MSGYLSLANGSNVPVRDGFVVGRVAGCDLVIDDTKASRRHLRIVVDNGVVEVEDLGSSNGTLLNGKPVARRLLRPGDRLQIGKTELVFHDGVLPGASPAASSPSPFADDDDVDLFSDKPATAASAPRAPAPVPPPPAAPPAPARPAPPPAPKQVVEFADEVVEVRRAPPVEAAAAAARPAASSGGMSNNSSRVLQFSKQAAGSGGLLGDDLNQMSSGMRFLLVVGVLGLGVGIVFGVMQLVG